MNVDQYVELFHARNGFSRQRMDAHAAKAFDAAVRDLVSLLCGRACPHLQRDDRHHLGTPIGWHAHRPSLEPIS